MMTLLADQIKLPLIQQRHILANARKFVIIDNTKTDSEEFYGSAQRGAEVLIVNSGIVLHNLAIRTALNKRASRPLLIWTQVADERSTEFILGEIIEAGATGSDGILFRNDEIYGTELAENIEKCRANGLSSLIEVKSQKDVEKLLQLGPRPDAIVTGGEIDIRLDDASILHINLKDPAPLSSQPKSSGTVERDDGSIGSFTTTSGAHGPFLYASPELIPTTDTDSPVLAPKYSPIVKVCGIRTIEAAKVALESGADMIGMILVPNRARSVPHGDAQKISKFVRSYQRAPALGPGTGAPPPPAGEGSIFSSFAHIIRAKTQTRPLIVGVFRNQPLETVLRLQHELSLDVVQLHGSEPAEWARLIPCPVIKRFTPNTPEFETSPIAGFHNMSLLDGEVGGEGKVVDWTAVASKAKMGARYLLAGGLTPQNVTQALQTQGVVGVDVSGGVESSEGVKDLTKVEQFVTAAKSVQVEY